MISVLIVEDDPMVGEINRQYIERVPGFRVREIVADGEAALTYLLEHPQVRLVFLDVFMPRMTGLDMLTQARALGVDVDVIFVTAAKEKKAIQKGLALGAVDYLIKPFTFERVRLALEKYRARARLFEESGEVDQAKLDQLFEVSASLNLPKGIHPLTLHRIQEAIQASPAGDLNLSSLGSTLHLSLVTLRLYLDYLVSRGEIKKTIRYGGIGRPTYCYSRWASPKDPTPRPYCFKDF
ncbi:Response regulator receiver [Clostridiaceae bacterium JG1575]|nr:Response regulator receiver [Clostridiaceae bacterium JG1575]